MCYLFIQGNQHKISDFTNFIYCFVIYHVKMNFRNFSSHNNYLCRICLTHSVEMHEFTEKLDDKCLTSPSLVIALKFVMNSKFLCDDRFPKHLCHLCKSLLQISYDLKKRFDESEKLLMSSFQISEDGIKDENKPIIIEVIEPEEKPPVEILIGNQKFDIKDLLIIDKPDECVKDFSGFLNNLGNEVSASFVKKEKLTITKDDNVEIISIEDVLQSHKWSSVNQVKSDIIENIMEMEDVSLEEQFSYDQSLGDENDPLECDINSYIIDCNTLSSIKPKKVDDIPNKFIITKHLFKCTNCKQTFQQKHAYLKHVKKDCIESDHTCKECGQKFATTSRLKRHISNNHNNIKCNICSFTCSARSVMLRHKAKHKGRAFVCEHCGKGFYMEKDMLRHKLIHTDKEAKKARELCPICGKVYSNLTYHVRAHLGVRDYKCEYCEKSFITSGQLKDHTRIHTGEKPFKCNICQRYFARIGMLKSHILTHTGVRPLKCKYCDKRFSKHGNMHIHAMQHHGPFKCSDCPKSYIEHRYLQRHFNKSHNIILKNSHQEKDRSKSKSNRPETFSSKNM